MRALDGTGTRGHALPQHVWVCVTGRWHDATPGVLLEWRQVHDKAGPRWEALVFSAAGGGNRTWDGRLDWYRAEHVRPARVTGPGREEAPPPTR